MDKQYVKGNSYFIRQNKTLKQYPYLAENLECEVLVIGGGVTGAITGHYLSKNNINTILIDKGRIAHESTSITTSLLQYELDDDGAKLKSTLDEGTIIRAYELGQFALDEIKSFVVDYGNKCFHKSVDSILFTAKKSEMKQIEDEYNFRKMHGFDVSYIEHLDMPFSFDFQAGLISHGGGAILDPVLFTHQLLDVANQNGMRIYENSEAVQIHYEEDCVLVETIYGYKIRCKKLIDATGYNTSLFTNRNLATKYTTFNLVTEPAPEIANYMKDIIIRDNGNPYHYFRTTHDNRIVIGGEDIPFDPNFNNETLLSKSYDSLHQLLYKICNIKLKVEYEYCGAFATTKDNLGYIGPDPKHPNLWYCLGYGANGILFAILGGYFLSKLYLGKEDKDMKLFQIDRK